MISLCWVGDYTRICIIFICIIFCLLFSNATSLASTNIDAHAKVEGYKTSNSKGISSFDKRINQQNNIFADAVEDLTHCPKLKKTLLLKKDKKLKLQNYIATASGLCKAYAEGKLADLYAKNSGEKSDYWSKKAAEDGDPIQALNLGVEYLFTAINPDKNHTISCKKALYWLTMSANRSFSSAYGDLCLYYMNGLCVPQNARMALKWCQLSWQKKSLLAPRRIAGIYQRSTDPNIKSSIKACEWYLKGAIVDDPISEANLGLCYEYGLGKPKIARNYQKAIYWYHKAALQGNPSAQDNLADMNYFGMGVQQDYSIAAYWYLKAAKSGLRVAQYNLAILYFHGYGIPKDYRKAVFWLKKAASQGDAEAKYYLAISYYNGYGVMQNYQQAYAWVNSAIASGLTGKLNQYALNFRVILENIIYQQDNSGQAIKRAKLLAQRYYNNAEGVL